MTTRPLIVLCNDDGIASPGLAAAAAALDPLGELLIVAPAVQQTGMGRSFPLENDGRISPAEVRYGDQVWSGYRANGSPAQVVEHAILELADRMPDLVVAGINYGENVTVGITASGTIGAALEAAMFGIPTVAVSMQVPIEQHYANEDIVDFTATMHFTRLFARQWLNGSRPPDVDILKLDVPAQATPDTPWRITRLERGPYIRAIAPLRRKLDDEGRLGYAHDPNAIRDAQSDAAAIRDGVVSVTPLTLDLTARIDPAALRRLLGGD
jgi:5'-nucleotidase